MLVVDAKGYNWDNIPLPYKEELEYDAWTHKANKYVGKTITTRSLCEYASSKGYTGVVFKNIVDNGGKKGSVPASNVYAFFKPQSQVKSADLVTYDDSGNIIPLSERFNADNEDIRFSDRVTNKELLDSEAESALYIKNTTKANYIGMILNGTKKVETRGSHTLDQFIGREVPITDGKYVYGYMTLGQPFEISYEDFHKKEFQKLHRVPKGDTYDAKNGKGKVAYPIESYRKIAKQKLSDTKDYKYSFQAREVKYSDRGYAPTFYSYMSNVINDIKPEKMGAGGVVSYLKGKGVKNEEIKWSGIEAFLEGKKSVTKSDLQEFAAGSMLQIEEETLTPYQFKYLEDAIDKMKVLYPSL